MTPTTHPIKGTKWRSLASPSLATIVEAHFLTIDSKAGLFIEVPWPIFYIMHGKTTSKNYFINSGHWQ